MLRVYYWQGAELTYDEFPDGEAWSVYDDGVSHLHIWADRSGKDALATYADGTWHSVGFYDG